MQTETEKKIIANKIANICKPTGWFVDFYKTIFIDSRWFNFKLTALFIFLTVNILKQSNSIISYTKCVDICATKTTLNRT
jgi:hypothetical protein